MSVCPCVCGGSHTGAVDADLFVCPVLPGRVCLRAFCLVPLLVPGPVPVHGPGLGGDQYSLVNSVMQA